MWYNWGMEDEVLEKYVEERKELVEWSAREYVVKERGAEWYLGMGVGAAVMMGVGMWMQYWTFVALVAVSVVALILYVNRPARELQYRLGEEGLNEGEKLYRFEDFKAFAVVQEGRNFSIVLVPRKRFGIQVRVYFPQDQGERIVDGFGARLPMEEAKMDILDKIVKFLRI